MFLNIDEKMFLFSFVNKHKVERKEEKNENQKKGEFCPEIKFLI